MQITESSQLVFFQVSTNWSPELSSLSLHVHLFQICGTTFHMPEDICWFHLFLQHFPSQNWSQLRFAVFSKIIEQLYVSDIICYRCKDKITNYSQWMAVDGCQKCT